jgi:hypothetical protein
VHGEPVEDGGGQRGVAEVATPVAERDVGGHGGRGATVAAVDQIVEGRATAAPPTCSTTSSAAATRSAPRSSPPTSPTSNGAPSSEGAACVVALVDRFNQHCHRLTIDADSWREGHGLDAGYPPPARHRRGGGGGPRDRHRRPDHRLAWRRWLRAPAWPASALTRRLSLLYESWGPSTPRDSLAHPTQAKLAFQVIAERYDPAVTWLPRPQGQQGQAGSRRKPLPRNAQRSLQGRELVEGATQHGEGSILLLSTQDRPTRNEAALQSEAFVVGKLSRRIARRATFES